MEKTVKFFDIQRRNSAFSLKDSLADLDFDVSHRACGHARYADADDLRIVIAGPLALYD